MFAFANIFCYYVNRYYRIKGVDIMSNFDLSTYSKHKIKTRQIIEESNSLNIPTELKKVYKVLSKKGKGIDEICSKLDMPSSKVLSSLTLLVIQGHIVQYPDNIFAKK